MRTCNFENCVDLTPYDSQRTPDYAFLMCVHGDSDYFTSALESILNQDTTENYEIIIVANNCSDALWQEVCSFAEQNPTVRTIRVRLGQHAFALNLGTELTRAKYILRMDSDDISLSDRLHKTIEIVSRNPNFDVYCFCAETFTIETNKNRSEDTRKILGRQPMRSLLLGNTVVHPATCIRADSLLAIGGYSGDAKNEDYDLWLRMDRAKFRFHQSDQVVLKYRIHPDQAAGSKLAYASSIGYSLRELVMQPSWKALFSLPFKLSKFALMRRKLSR